MKIDLTNKLSRIKLLILDVDGVLTDGRLHYSADGENLKVFHVHDGAGIKRLQNHGVAVAIISARTSAAVSKRTNDLGVQHVYQGQSDKTLAFNELLQKLDISAEAIAYMGDDLADLPVMQQVGLKIAVANAIAPIREIADYLTLNSGGHGAVREVCELIIAEQTKATS